MTTTLNFKDKIDLPEWRPLSSAILATAAGHCLAHDLRNTIKEQNPHIWCLQALTYINRYLSKNDAWIEGTAFTTMGGAIGLGTMLMFCPSHGPSGTINGTPTTTSFTLAALPNSASVLANQLADAGGGVGFKIRVIGNGAGGSGKVEERFIVGNSAGTTPIVTLDTALTFTPQTTDSYEILSGRLYIITTGTTAAGYLKAFDVATMSISGNLTITNLAATIGTDSAAVMLDEQYVPYNRRSGEGFLGIDTTDASHPDGALKCLTATGSAAETLTGQATGGDAAAGGR